MQFNAVHIDSFSESVVEYIAEQELAAANTKNQLTLDSHQPPARQYSGSRSLLLANIQCLGFIPSRL
jgi:hypothetical protein